MAGLYGILGLDSNASPEDIRKAYQRLARKWHPDKNVGYESEAVNRFSEISEAYDVLSDRSKREQYDAFCVTGIPRVSSFDFPHPHNGFSFQLNFTEGRLQDSCGNLVYNEPYASENGSMTNNERIDQTTSFPYPQFSTNLFSSVSSLKRGPEFLYDCVESKIPAIKPPGKVSEKRKPSPKDIFVAKKPKFDGVILSEMET